MKTKKEAFMPGDWVNNNGNIKGKWQDGTPVGIAIVGVTQFCGSESGGLRDIRMKAEDKANARLIASAPCLLSALTGLLLVADHPNNTMWTGANAEFIKVARAAIAKAEGHVLPALDTDKYPAI